MSKRWIPNLLTVISLFAGLMTILMAFTRQWLACAILIFGAALFDSLGGRIARRLNMASDAGKKLDTLADFVSFGIAPAIVAFLLHFSVIGWSGYVLTTLFPLCGALRLSRIAIGRSHRGYYLGLPLAAAGCLLVAIAVLGQSLSLKVQAVVLIILSAMMILNVKVPKI